MSGFVYLVEWSLTRKKKKKGSLGFDRVVMLVLACCCGQIWRGDC
jgi:hypothetical protein